MKISPSAGDPGEFAALERAAAEWFFRKDRGLTPAEERELAAWLQTDERHAAVFAEIEDTWNDLPAVKARVLASAGCQRGTRRSEGLSDAGGRTAPRRLGTLVWLPASLAFAAALTLAYLGWWRPAHYSGEAVTGVGGLRQLSLADGSKVQLNTDSAVIVNFSREERRVRLERGEAHFTVAKDPARPFIVMAGGIDVRAVGTAFNVRLLSDSVDVLVTDGKVAVGAAVTTVWDAPSPGPRIVGGGGEGTWRPGDGHAGGRASDALDAAVEGMNPTVARRAAGELSRGHMAEVGDGSSEIGGPRSALRSPRTALILEAGHRATIPLPAAGPAPAPSVKTLSGAVIERTLAWRMRRVEFADAPLAEMVAEFNRYNRHQLVIADSHLAEMRFGGSFPTSDYESFVQVLETTFHVTVRRGEDRTILSLRS